MLGFETGEMSGKSILDFLPSESEREDVRARLECLVRQQTSPAPWFGTHRAKDGRLISVQSEGNYKRDGLGQVTGYRRSYGHLRTQEGGGGAAGERDSDESCFGRYG